MRRGKHHHGRGGGGLDAIDGARAVHHAQAAKVAVRDGEERHEDVGPRGSGKGDWEVVHTLRVSQYAMECN